MALIYGDEWGLLAANVPYRCRNCPKAAFIWVNTQNNGIVYACFDHLDRWVRNDCRIRGASWD